MEKDIIAIDFGTTNTYITFGPYNTKNKTPLMIGGKTPEISTALLYSDVPDADTEIYPILGNRAVRRFGTSKSEEIDTRKYRLVSHFKPSITASEEARRNTVDFFKTILRDTQKLNLPFSPLNHHVIIGVPSESSHEYQETLKRLAKEAGYGDVDLVHEPKGAVLHDLGSNLFPLGELLAGTLIVDFGGGTCDYVYMKNGEIKYSWGDMELGGQLFDDLFYQWFRNQNPEIVKDLEKTGKDFLVRVEDCRVCKENFSDDINHGNDHVGLLQIGHYGYLENLGREDFEQRARNYAPSGSLLKYWNKFGIPTPEKLRNGETDLIKWFYDTLLEGLDVYNIATNKVHVVSLAGGSSLWYFVREFCHQQFGKDCVQTNPAPYAAISEGLAILPAIQSEFARKKKSVQNDQADFIDKTIGPRITESFDCSRASIVDKVLSALFDQKIVPNLKEFREKGGTISSLKENLEKELSGCKKKLEDDVERSLHENLNGLYKSSLDSTKYWLEDHGLRMADVGTKLPHCQDGVELVPVNPVSLNTFVHFLNALIVTITGAVVASICGGSGWALILAGPAGLVIGFVIAAVATVPFLLGYRKRFRDLLGRKLSIPSFILKRYALTDKKIEKCRRKLGESLAQEINKQKAQTLAQLKKHLGEVIQDEIDCLSIINVM